MRTPRLSSPRPIRPRFAKLLLMGAGCAVLAAYPAAAQSVAANLAPEVVPSADPITTLTLSIGRSVPMTTPLALTKVSVATSDIADVVVVGPRELALSGKTAGETDVIFWFDNGTRQHLRVLVRPPADRPQIAVYIKFAEVRRDLLRTIGVSARFRDQQGHTRIGTGVFNTDNPFNTDGSITLPSKTGFATVLTDFNTQRLLALLDLEEQKGRSRTLAEPNVLAGNREEANFLAGGELPIPVVQGSGTNSTGVNTVTIVYKEFGIRLRFVPEIINDSLVKLSLRPEVSSLDYSNAVQLSGFSIPAFRTRRIETTLDVRRDQSLVISGLFNDEQERVRTGVPFLQDVPVLGQLFSSTRWQRHESELLVIVTPIILDARRPRPQDLLPIVPDTTVPAREAFKHRLPAPVTPSSSSHP